MRRDEAGYEHMGVFDRRLVEWSGVVQGMHYMAGHGRQNLCDSYR